VRLGLGPIDLSAISARELRALAEAAGSATFDSVWVAESRASGTGGALAAAAMVAQWTQVRVGAVVDLGLYHPLHLAEDVAVADIASGGRIELMLRPAHDDPDVIKEHLHVLAAALAGAHIQWEGLHLRIPARLADNGAVPTRLAVNPPPVQPVVPVWIFDSASEWTAMADRLGYGLGSSWHAGLSLEAGRRIPRLVLCPQYVEPADLVAAAGEHSGYFVVSASTPADVADAGRRLVGPLRMPDFPDWVHARR
jgi:alkanesulfonate monooxygenase SsuD/methylene tetrahydromethanopterin reductase-like flavin-dependent oxidoreductase (luciferase family)